MARRNKQQKQSNRYSLLDSEIRPVTKNDEWCERKMPFGRIPEGDAPWGYVVTIPYCPNKNTFLENVDGYIVRTKVHCGNLLLQVVKKEYAPEYGVKSFSRERDAKVNRKKLKSKKKLYRVISIRNLNKVNNKWGRVFI